MTAEPHPVPAWRRATQMESRVGVSAAIAVMVVAQVWLSRSLIDGLLTTPGIVAAAAQVLLGIVLWFANVRGVEHTSARMRRLSLGLVAVASLGNAVLLVVLLSTLLGAGTAPTPGRLLGSGGLVWLSNVIVFGLWYWELDRGGPAARAGGREPVPDFLFPQMTTPELFPGWEPRFADYAYVAWTNATAFSPTDTLPVSAWAKATMTLQSAISLATAALVIARAVNILG